MLANMNLKPVYNKNIKFGFEEGMHNFCEKGNELDGLLRFVLLDRFRITKHMDLLKNMNSLINI